MKTLTVEDLIDGVWREWKGTERALDDVWRLIGRNSFKSVNDRTLLADVHECCFSPRDVTCRNIYM